MTGTILCGVDGSRAARGAVAVAKELSERLDSRLVLVHVAADERERREAEFLLAEIVVDHWLGSATERRIAFGNPRDVLAVVADEERADLLVVGARRRRPLAGGILGSVATAVAGRAPCPVVVVPPRVGIRSSAGAAADPREDAAR